jgi:hypothetical protein
MPQISFAASFAAAEFRSTCFFASPFARGGKRNAIRQMPRPLASAALFVGLPLAANPLFRSSSQRKQQWGAKKERTPANVHFSLTDRARKEEKLLSRLSVILLKRSILTDSRFYGALYHGESPLNITFLSVTAKLMQAL